MSLARLSALGLKRLLRRLRPGGGTSLPGWVILALEPGFLRQHLSSFRERIVVTGTNGKSSTAHLIARLLTAEGYRVVHNQEGANLRQGLAASLLEGEGEVAVLEVDEASLAPLVCELQPTLILLTGLFRDQLDRYGEVERARSALHRAFALAPQARFLINGDDPLSAALAPEGSTFFSVEGLPHLEVPGDAPACPRCGGELLYRWRSYAHLGDYRCPSCGFARPKPAFVARFGEAFRFQDQPLPPPPEYLHPYSATAALAAVSLLGAWPKELAWPPPSWGRGERWDHAGREVLLNLVKNPASLSFSLAWYRASVHLLEINDGIADGQDVSWLWDVDYPPLKRVLTTGSRGLEMLIRLRYLEVPEARAYAQREEALASALALAREGERILYLSNYTGLRKAWSLLQRPQTPREHPPQARLGAPLRPAGRQAAVRLVHLFPGAMGTYGDGGNLQVLRKRLEWRGFVVEPILVQRPEDFPTSADFFLLGGGEDRAQRLVAEALFRLRPELKAWLEDGVAGLLVCGGMQLFGEVYATGEGEIPGLGLLPLETRAGEGRLVGRIRVRSPLTSEVLVGFENHAGRSRVEGQVLGEVLQGHGNLPEGRGGEGIVQGHLIGTYLHGPVLARNPWLADWFLRRILERRGLGELEPLDDEIERLAASQL